MVKEKFIFEVTRSLVLKIKEAYSKFIMAHESLENMKKNYDEIISNLISSKYKFYIEYLKSNNLE